MSENRHRSAEFHEESQENQGLDSHTVSTSFHPNHASLRNSDLYYNLDRKVRTLSRALCQECGSLLICRELQEIRLRYRSVGFSRLSSVYVMPHIRNAVKLSKHEERCDICATRQSRICSIATILTKMERADLDVLDSVVHPDISNLVNRYLEKYG